MFGLIDEPPQARDYEFNGSQSLGGVVIKPDCNWLQDIPPLEVQQNNVFDTWSCATYATIHAICTLAHAKFGQSWDKSERFTSTLAGTVPDKGTSLRNVLESVRKNGTVDGSLWPFTPEMDSNTFFEPIDATTKNLGLQWLLQYSFGWEWVSKIVLPVFDKEKAFEALKYSPLITAVDVNSPIEGDFVQNTVTSYNHAKVIVNAVYGQYWETADSYLGTTNKYVWDYQFHAPAKISLDRGVTKKTILDTLCSFFK